jgi:hypothetical protein
VARTERYCAKRGGILVDRVFFVFYTYQVIKAIYMGKKNPTISDVIDAIGVFSNKVDGRFDNLEARMDKLEHQMGALNSSVKNYLELSDKRYLELRQTNRIIFKYLKLVVQKAKVPVDLKELEQLIK